MGIWEIVGIIALLIGLLILGVIIFVIYKAVKIFKKVHKKSKSLLSESEDEIELEEGESDDDIVDGFEERIAELKKDIADKQIKREKVYIMNLDGVIKYESEPKSSFQSWTKMLEKTIRDKPPGLIVRINSPGGTVAATQELYNLIEAIRVNGTKVVVLMEDVAASGGLYASMAGEKIIANSGTITGSAGVIMQGMNYGDFLKKHNIQFTTIKAGERKDIMSPVRQMTPDEEKFLTTMALDTQAQFLNCISTRRNMKPEDMDEISDARILTGNQALKLGLVDKLGGYPAAVAEMSELLGLADGKGFKYVHLKPPQTPIERFLGKSFIKANIPFLNKLDPLAEEMSLRGPLWLMPRV